MVFGTILVIGISFLQVQFAAQCDTSGKILDCNESDFELFRWFGFWFQEQVSSIFCLWWLGVAPKCTSLLGSNQPESITTNIFLLKCMKCSLLCSSKYVICMYLTLFTTIFELFCHCVMYLNRFFTFVFPCSKSKRRHTFLFLFPFERPRNRKSNIVPFYWYSSLVLFIIESWTCPI